MAHSSSEPDGWLLPSEPELGEAGETAASPGAADFDPDDGLGADALFFRGRRVRPPSPTPPDPDKIRGDVAATGLAFVGALSRLEPTAATPDFPYSRFDAD